MGERPRRGRGGAWLGERASLPHLSPPIQSQNPHLPRIYPCSIYVPNMCLNTHLHLHPHLQQMGGPLPGVAAGALVPASVSASVRSRAARRLPSVARQWASPSPLLGWSLRRGSALASFPRSSPPSAPVVAAAAGTVAPFNEPRPLTAAQQVGKERGGLRARV